MNLSPKTKKYIGWGLVALAVLVAGLLGYSYPVPPAPEDLQDDITAILDDYLLDTAAGAGIESATNLDSLILDDDMTVGDDLTVTGLATVGETLGVTGATTLSSDLTVDGILELDPIAYTSTGAQNLTPAGSYYELSPVAVLTLTLQTGSAAAGDILILASTVATQTTVVDTGATVGGGAITLAENDLAMFIYLNDIWAEIASPDNS